jgi:hypothetical protein
MIMGGDERYVVHFDDGQRKGIVDSRQLRASLLNSLYPDDQHAQALRLDYFTDVEVAPVVRFFLNAGENV